MTLKTLETLLHLAREAQAASRFPDSHYHGVGHWRGVVDQGLWLAERLGALGGQAGGQSGEHTQGWGREARLFLFVFGAVHDCQRVNEHRDPAHGARAAEWLEREAWVDRLGLTHVGGRLVEALIRHDHGETTTDALIGAAWDADRSLLARVGITPKDRYFSTARGPLFAEMVARGGSVAACPDTWETLAKRALA